MYKFIKAGKNLLDVEQTTELLTGKNKAVEQLRT